MSAIDDVAAERERLRNGHFNYYTAIITADGLVLLDPRRGPDLDLRSCLVRAAALIVAEIDKMDNERKS